jgi:hypothetical protein
MDFYFVLIWKIIRKRKETKEQTCVEAKETKSDMKETIETKRDSISIIPAEYFNFKSLKTNIALLTSMNDSKHWMININYKNHN